MKLFLDTANLDEIKETAKLGLIDGVTTNPSLIAKEGGRELRDVVAEICDIVNGPVSAEVISTDFEGMQREADALLTIHENIVVKVPMTEAGLQTVSTMAPQGVRFNVTLVFSLAQSLLAAKAGAYFLSPFVGRWDDIDTPGIELIPDIVTMYENYGFETEILVASVRSPLHVTDAALAGAHIATIPYKVFKQLFKHPLTDIGLAKFLADHKKSTK